MKLGKIAMKQRPSAVAALALCLLTTGCGLEKKVSSGLQDSLSVNNSPGTVGIKSASNFVPALEAVTGISSDTAAALVLENGTQITLKDQVSLSTNFLPQTGEVNELGPTTLLVMQSLANHYARVLTRKERGITDATKRTFYGAVDFTKDPSKALDAGTIDKVLGIMGSKFIQRKISADEVAVINHCIADQISEIGTVAATSDARGLANEKILSVCTAGHILGSMSFIKD